MKKNEIIYQNILTKGNAIILICSPEGIIIDAGKSTLEILGTHILKKNITDIFIDYHHSLDLKNLPDEGSLDHLISIKTDSEMPESYLFNFYRDDEEKIIIIGNHDSYEVEQLKIELLKSNNTLLNKTRELEKKNNELNRLSQTKNEFLGMAAHDLRNPIGNIKTIAEILLSDNGKNEKETVNYINMIKDISSSMLMLLNDFLDISAIESGKLKLNKELSDIKKTIENSLFMYKTIAQKKSIHIQTDYDNAIPLFFFDALKIQQVFNNLISNALKYSEDNTGIIISAELQNNTIIFTIQDQGVGIPEHDIAGLFRPFSKTGAHSPSGEKSTGLGLTIVKKIIDEHEGSIMVNSTVGKGTTISFTLPLITQIRD